MEAFGVGILACLFATLALVVEYLVRPSEIGRFFLPKLLLRFFLVVTALAAICFWMVEACWYLAGHWRIGWHPVATGCRP